MTADIAKKFLIWYSEINWMFDVHIIISCSFSYCCESKCMQFNFLFHIEDAWGYIEETREMVHDLEQRVQKAKDNVDTITKLMQTWNKLPLFERKKESKTDHMLSLDDRNDRINKRYNEIKDVGDKIHGLVKVQ